MGFGSSDPDLDGVIGRLSTIYERSFGQYFKLISEDEFSSLERRRLLQDKRLDCITYRKDASHSQVVEFLRALIQRNEQNDEFKPPFSDVPRLPRIFISGCYRHLELLFDLGILIEKDG